MLQFCKKSDAWRHIYLYHSVTLCVLLQILVTASRALLLKQWDWKQAQCTRSWRAIHTIPIASMTFDPTSTLLATGQLLKGVHELVQLHLCVMLVLYSRAQDCHQHGRI